MNIIKIIKNPWLIFKHLAYKGYFSFLSDKAYVQLMYHACMGKRLNLRNPETFTEKLQWLKLYNKNDKYTNLVDKYEVKPIISKIIGEEHIIRTLGVWNSFNEINFDNLPNKFVLKCTHNSGGVIIVRDKTKFKPEEAQKEITKCLKSNFFSIGREWPYKKVIPRIIAEEYMEDSITKDLRDYKFFCFNGVAKALFVATERQNNGAETKFDFFDMDYTHLDFCNGHPNADVSPKKPKNLCEMRTLAEKLSVGIPHVRVDFYEVNGKIYFGEMTFFHWSGFVPFEPDNWDYIFGSWITLPNDINR